MNIYNLINKYIKKINAKISNNEILGKDLINLTESKQINLFIIKNIHEEWNKNFKKNKLDYFNYEDPEVISSINNLMNTLSNNIKLETNVIRSVLFKAINDVLNLVNNSHEFIKRDLANEDNYSVKKLIAKSKYYCYHKGIFDHLINELQQSSTLNIKTNELFEYFDDIPIKENQRLNNELSSLLNTDLEEIKKLKQNNSEYYSLFSLDKNKVDDLMIIAKSKENFEQASNIILENLNDEFQHKINHEKIKNLLISIKKGFT